jgi:hypothetical protein
MGSQKEERPWREDEESKIGVEYGTWQQRWKDS